MFISYCTFVAFRGFGKKTLFEYLSMLNVLNNERVPDNNNCDVNIPCLQMGAII